MPQVNNPPEFAEAEEPRRSHLPAIVKRFARFWMILGVLVILFLVFYSRGGKPPTPPQYGAQAAGIRDRGNVRESPGPAARENPKGEAEAQPAPTSTPTPTPTPAIEAARYERTATVPVAPPAPTPLPPQRFQDVFRAGTPDEEVATTAEAPKDIVEADPAG